MSGLTFERHFCPADQDPYETVLWNRRDVVIQDQDGKIIFEQEQVEAPESWSDTAVKIVASRYLRGKLGSPDRENSIRQMIARVVGTIVAWGLEQGYFATRDDALTFHDELVVILLLQKASFNSPVWFNLGVSPKPMVSACFILSVDDTIESILEWYRQEGLIFRDGSGSGVNISKLRSCREYLSSGGRPSGPVSFMKAADSVAGVIKSGGKTRRASKLVCMDIDHPDIRKFIACKVIEEEKARALTAAGYGGGISGEAYQTVAFQNSNHSVRISDAFMKAAANDEPWIAHGRSIPDQRTTFSSETLINHIAQAIHKSGEPGIQFHDTINRWHTCPAAGEIRASNPCSEFMFIDNSACNLASLRLTALLESKTGLHDFIQTIDIVLTAQDIMVDKAFYPNDQITHNSRAFRPLGLGFTDLGAALMLLGFPYDSDKGRGFAAAISSLMTARAYLQSARLAQKLGAFSEYASNREALIDVLRSHMLNTEAMPTSQHSFTEMLRIHAQSTWELTLDDASRYGLRNSQTTLVAPTGTISFMMDCATTGIEPAYSLITTKSLAGGGEIEQLNTVVYEALLARGYHTYRIRNLVEWCVDHGDFSGCPTPITPEDERIFHCAIPARPGGACILPVAHLEMMAAVQPFISGAISKTVNLPAETSVPQIEQLVQQAWELGLKSVAFYRDGSKATQPLTNGCEKQKEEQPLPSQPAKEQQKNRIPYMPHNGLTRKKLETECESRRHKFSIAGHEGYLHVGLYDNDQPGEIFIRMSKEGSTISGLMDTIATLTSLALQYGVPLDVLVNKFSHVRYEPAGFTGNSEIPIAKSITDYVFRYLGKRFLPAPVPIESLEEHDELEGVYADFVQQARPQEDGLMTTQIGLRHDSSPCCSECGTLMVQAGTCYYCPNCGANTGCS